MKDNRKQPITKQQVWTIVTIVIALLVLLATVLLTWQWDFWEHELDQFGTFSYIYYAGQNIFIALIVFGVEIAAIIVINRVLRTNSGRYVWQLGRFSIIALLISVGFCVVLFLLNLFFPTQFGALAYYYMFGVRMILIIPYFKLDRNSCPKCYFYKTKIVVDTEESTYYDYDDLKTVNKRQIKVDGTVVEEVRELAPTEHTETTYTYECSNCKCRTTSEFADFLF